MWRARIKVPIFLAGSLVLHANCAAVTIDGELAERTTVGFDDSAGLKVEDPECSQEERVDAELVFAKTLSRLRDVGFRIVAVDADSDVIAKQAVVLNDCTNL